MKLTAVLFLLIIPCLLFGNDSLNVRRIGSWPYSSSFNVVSLQDISYLSVGGGLWIFNTSNPANPIKVGELNLSCGFITDMAKKDRKLYLSSSSVGLIILDISNPLTPIIQSTYRIRFALSVAVESTYAFITNYDSLYIIDISSPLQPVFISSAPVYGTAVDIFLVSTRFAYICLNPGGFIVFNISNPQLPIPVGGWSPPPNNITVKSIWVRDGYAYVANRDSLRILNVANLQNIFQVGVWGSCSPWNDAIHTIFIKNGLAYLAFDYWGVHIVDISNPYAPFQCSQIQIDTDRDIKVVDSLAYVATMAGLGILNVSNPYQPSLLSHWNKCPGWNLSVNISHDNTLSVLGCLEGVFLIDISNIYHPQLRGYVHYPTKWAYDTETRDSLVYVSFMDSFRIINIANPDSPQVIASKWQRWSRAISKRNNLIYLCAQGSSPEAGFYIIDISNLNNPVILSFVHFESDAYGLCVQGNYAYIGDGLYHKGVVNEGGLRIFNIADSTNPNLVSHTIPNFERGTIKGITTHNNIAYVCDDDHGLLIYNIQDPINPVLLHFYPTASAADIVVQNNIAYLADGYYGIRVLDISNFSSIQELGFYKISGYANSIKVVNNYVHVAFGSSGYLIFQYYGAGVEEKGSEKVKRRFGLKLHPKPTNKSSLIEYSIVKNCDMSLDILDSIGRVIKTLKKEQMNPGNYKFNLNTSKLSPGVYYIRLKQDTEQTVEKLVIVN